MPSSVPARPDTRNTPVTQRIASQFHTGGNTQQTGIQWPRPVLQKTVATHHQICLRYQPSKLVRISQKNRIIQIQHKTTTRLAKSQLQLQRLTVKDLAINEHQIKSLQTTAQPVPPPHTAFQQLTGTKTHPRKIVVLGRKAVQHHSAMPVLTQTLYPWLNTKSR